MGLGAQGDSNSTKYSIPSEIPEEYFRVYDIRGPVSKAGLTPDLAYCVGLAIAAEVRSLGQKDLIVARDGRLSGPVFVDALCRGVQDAGVNVIYIGVMPTPVLYFATNFLAINSGVMVTASHNPKDHNGFKIVLNGKTLRSEGIQAILQRIKNKDFYFGEVGKFSKKSIMEDYTQYITDHIQLKRSLKVVVDCGNGVAGLVAPKLYRALGCEVIELFCEVDGNFPNHHPDPTVPKNLLALIEKVKITQADLGLAFDGDADRLGVVTDKGEIIWPDRQLMLFSIDLLKRHPGAEVIFDVKCSRHLPIVIRQHGGVPLMWRTGHSVLKAKLFERDALLAGELSGHIFFRDEWFGFDDGLYVGARLLRIISEQNCTVNDVFDTLPNSVNTPELKIPMPEVEKVVFMQQLLDSGDFSKATIDTLDGMRVEYADGWGLIRPSNTSPYLILRFEAENEDALKRIQMNFREQLLKISDDLKIPF